MTPRLAALASLIGAVIGACIGIAQEAVSPRLPAMELDRAGVRRHAAAHPAVVPGDVTVRVDPPRWSGSRFAGLLDSIDTTHKGYVTPDDIAAYYERKLSTRHAEASAQAAR